MSAKLDSSVGLYLEGIRDGHVAAALEKYIGDRYTRRHSTGVADGKEGFQTFFTPFLVNHPDRDIRIVRAFEDGSYVFVHVYQRLDGGAAEWVTTDLFDTDANDKIVEHWDVISAFTGPNHSGRTQVDGDTGFRDLEQTEANKVLVAEYTRVVLQGGQVDHIADFVSDTLAQHSPETGDGIDALRQKLATAGRKIVYRTLFRIVGSGHFVVTYSHVAIGRDEFAVFDIYRLERGLIVEHWDNAELIPTSQEAGNSGKF